MRCTSKERGRPRKLRHLGLKSGTRPYRRDPAIQSAFVGFMGIRRLEAMDMSKILSPGLPLRVLAAGSKGLGYRRQRNISTKVHPASVAGARISTNKATSGLAPWVEMAPVRSDAHMNAIVETLRAHSYATTDDFRPTLPEHGMFFSFDPAVLLASPRHAQEKSAYASHAE